MIHLYKLRGFNFRILSFLVFILNAIIISAQCPGSPATTLGGKVFKDQNFDGVDDGGVGWEGITVSLFNNSGLVTTTTTNSSGNYAFPGLTFGTYRIEFSSSTADCVLFPTQSGSNRGNVQFYSAGTCSANVGYGNPDHPNNLYLT